MSSDGNVALSVRGLSKAYTIAHEQQRHVTLAEAMLARLRHPFRRATTETFWALRDVSFDVPRGEVLGVIGRNGAGKSTLLKVLSRITEPTSGEIDLYGRVGSLLEVGTGFHPELTGRENIYLNGAILGMRKAEIDRQFDAIVDFSGVETFLDTPVKRYSSGMYVRLAFAVAAHLEPEILVVDEVLAVGDAEFQKKCLGKMKDVAQSGRTILFVSHNMAAVTNLCTSAVVMANGKLAYHGTTEGAVANYLAATSRGSGAADGEQLQQYRLSWARPYVTAARVLGADGSEQSNFSLGSDLIVELTFEHPDPGGKVSYPVMGVVINHATLGVIGNVNTRMTGWFSEHGPRRSATMRCTLKRPPLLQGQYAIDLWLSEGHSPSAPAVDHLDCLTGALSFTIEPSDLYGSGRTPDAGFGAIFLDPAWEIEPAAPPTSPRRIETANTP